MARKSLDLSERDRRARGLERNPGLECGADLDVADVQRFLEQVPDIRLGQAYGHAEGLSELAVVSVPEIHGRHIVFPTIDFGEDQARRAAGQRRQAMVRADRRAKTLEVLDSVFWWGY